MILHVENPKQAINKWVEEGYRIQDKYTKLQFYILATFPFSWVHIEDSMYKLKVELRRQFHLQ